MFGAFERAVAFRYLRSRRGERFVSVIAGFSLLGIALGVATLIIVTSVMNGFRQELLSRILGLNGDLAVYASGEGLKNFDAATAAIRRIPGVLSATPIVEGQALLTNESGAAVGGLIRGIRRADLQALPSVSDHIIAGSLAHLAGDDAVAIGSGLAQTLGLTIGSRLTLVSPQGAATVVGTIPRIRSYQVVAIFQVGMNEYDSSFVFLPLEAAQTFFQKPDEATQIQVTVQHPDAVGAIDRAIAQVLPGQPVRIIDWTQANDSFFAAVTVERNVMFLILTLIILVAAFNIVSSLIMMVKDKTRDIAILRTIGAGRGAVMRIFLMCGASVGIVGTVAGTVIGVLFCRNIETIRQWLQSLTGTNLFNPEVYYLEQLPAVLDWGEVVRVIVMALALSLLATLYPSWRAARTDPVEALRHE
ncbi:MAG TPA: lipoprotein-releasing ABC transporter permease subunit [Acetobacteraceae bacterium]|jgi:lipoprotein-releasing system permease protein|nr:lipoprotein-releasing ABC transporter permease subunit [Acetobacteraceae bacterium]